MRDSTLLRRIAFFGTLFGLVTLPAVAVIAKEVKKSVRQAESECTILAVMMILVTTREFEETTINKLEDAGR